MDSTWLRRIAREWLVITELLLVAAFAAGDGAGWIEAVVGHRPPKEWLFLGALLLFGITALFRLVSLQTRLDESRNRVRFAARSGFYSQNDPTSRLQPPLSRDEISIETTIYFDVWTDIDVDTANLVLNVVCVRRRHWWQVWNLLLPKYKRMLGIRPEGQDTAMYRKQIRRTDKQPFEDHATFKWRGKRGMVDWGDAFLLELALETGSPKDIWRAILDPRFYERGSTTAL